MKEKKGTKALEGKPEEKRHEEKKPAKKGGDKETKGMHLAGIMTRPLKDGTFHHEHHMEDKDGIPHHKTFGYSSATKEDAADHMMEHLPEPPQGAQGDDEAAEGEAPAQGAQPDASQQEMPPQ